MKNKKNNLDRNRNIGIVVLLIVLILDVINISDIINIPLYNINLELWNILVIIILYVLAYEIIDKRDNKRKKNQEEIARILLEETYKECDKYKYLISDKIFKEICPKRFSGNQTMENNSAYHDMRKAPFEHDSIIFSLGEEGIITASDILNYINVKNKYNVYFSNVVCFPDIDDITDPLKYDLEIAIDKAVIGLKR